MTYVVSKMSVTIYESPTGVNPGGGGGYSITPNFGMCRGRVKNGGLRIELESENPEPGGGGGHSTFNWSGCAAGGLKTGPCLKPLGARKIYPVLIYLTKDVHIKYTLF